MCKAKEISVALAMATGCAVCAQSANWELRWADEFDSDAVDTSQWTFEHGFRRNMERQWYVDPANPDDIARGLHLYGNATVKDGKLHIRAVKLEEPVDNPHYDPDKKPDNPKNRYRTARPNILYTSASINTNGKFSFNYEKGSRVECRARVPQGRGVWPAIWMCGTRFGWPKGGEIDIMEYIGEKAPNATKHNVHWDGNAGEQEGGERKQKSHGTSHAASPPPHSEFITYIWEMFPEYMDMYYQRDGHRPTRVLRFYLDQATGTGGYNPFRDPKNTFFLWLNLAFGGGYVGDTEDDFNIEDRPSRGFYDPSILPKEFIVDFIRVYENTGGFATNTRPPTVEVTAPAKGHVFIADESGKANVRIKASITDPEGSENGWISWTKAEKSVRNEDGSWSPFSWHSDNHQRDFSKPYHYEIKDLPPGEYRLKVTASDGKFNGSGEVKITVKEKKE